MTAALSVAAPAHPDDWLPILELAVQEVFEIMLGTRVDPAPQSEDPPHGGFTAMVGLAGGLSGVLTFCCGSQVAGRIAARMLGSEVASSDGQVGDALGELCNMIAGNFKNKLTGLDDRCLLGVPTVVIGAEYHLHSLAAGNSLKTVLLFEGAPVAVRLALQR